MVDTNGPVTLVGALSRRFSDHYEANREEKRNKGYSRVLKLTIPSKLITLQTLGPIGITFDLLLPASHTSYRKPFSWFAGLGDSPIDIDRLPVNDFSAVGAIFIHIT